MAMFVSLSGTAGARVQSSYLAPTSRGLRVSMRNRRRNRQFHGLQQNVGTLDTSLCEGLALFDQQFGQGLDLAITQNWIAEQLQRLPRAVPAPTGHEQMMLIPYRSRMQD